MTKRPEPCPLCSTPVDDDGACAGCGGKLVNLSDDETVASWFPEPGDNPRDDAPPTLH